MARSAKRNAIPPVPVTEEDPAFDTDIPNADRPSNVAGISGQILRSFIERIERLKSEIGDLQADVREIKKEAKGAGFEVKVINHLIRERAQDADDIAEFDAILDTYRRAIG